MEPISRKNMWRERIERCLASGMSRSEWCKLNKIAPSSLYYWMVKFRKEENSLFPEPNASEWIEITKKDIATNVALVPAKDSTSLKTSPAVGVNKRTAYNNSSSIPPVINTRVNGIEMSIAPGCTQTDIEAVFKAAMSL